MILGHIGVRAGSKGVQGKNFRDLHGKPLLQYALDQLLEHPRIDHVMISTDGAEMRDFAVNLGAIDIGLRPAHLANDTAGKWDVWVHSLAEVEKIIGPVTTFVDLDCTAPMRDPIDITNALDLFDAEKPDMVMSCCHAQRNPYFNIVEPDETGALQVSKKLDQPILSRQNAPLVYDHAGGTYVLKPDYLRRASGLYEGRVIPYVMPAQRCVDIDEESDFQYVQWLMGQKIANGE